MKPFLPPFAAAATAQIAAGVATSNSGAAYAPASISSRGGSTVAIAKTTSKPGQTTGPGVNQFGGLWWVISPAGKEVNRRG